MSAKKMLFVAEKETFVARVLIKKAQEAGVECTFSTYEIDTIDLLWDDAKLIVLYMEEHVRPKESTLHFISDKMDEKDTKVILVGDKENIAFASDNIAGELIYRSFTRPVDNTKFSDALIEYYEKLSSGDFKKSIMIVDDDPQYLNLARQWLRDTYKVYMANSGLQAIKMLGKNKVDLILLDHEMPVTTGPQVLEMLRSDDETKNIPVMFLTGKNDKKSVMEVVALKPEGYFLKTIQREELLHKLHEYFVLHK